MNINATTYRSPNHNARPAAVSAIVIHTSEGQWDSDADWLRNPKSGVSSHYIINPAGQIYQLVPEGRRAWHAGVSSYLGRTDWNDFSIGVEISHTAGGPIGVAQLGALDWLVRTVIARYRIAQRMIVAHRWIAPDRKIDPTNWNDQDFTAWVASLYSAPARYVIVLGATVYADSLLTQPVTHLPANAVIRSDAQAPQPGYAPDAVHVFWDGANPGSGFMHAADVANAG